MADDLEVLNPAAGDRRRLAIIGKLIQLKFYPRAARATPCVRADISQRNNKTLIGTGSENPTRILMKEIDRNCAALIVFAGSTKQIPLFFGVLRNYHVLLVLTEHF